MTSTLRIPDTVQKKLSVASDITTLTQPNSPAWNIDLITRSIKPWEQKPFLNGVLLV